MASDVDIANLALRAIGDDPITTLTDNTPRAKIVNANYEHVRDQVLRAHPWSFAMARATLARLSSIPEFEFAFEYQLPADSLRTIELSDSNIVYRIEGKKLLTDAETVELRYIKQVTDPAQFDALFVIAFAALLAAEIAYPITTKLRLAEDLRIIYERKLSEARSMTSMEGTPVVFVANEFKTVR